MPWCINTGKSLIPLTLLFLHQKRNLLIPLELSRVMHQGRTTVRRNDGARVDRRRLLEKTASGEPGGVERCGHCAKGGALSSNPMTARLSEALQSHRHLRGPRVLCESDGSPLTERRVQGFVGRSARRANLENGGVHVLRHTFCSHLAMRGAPAKAIQELAGHKDLSTTQRYMHLSPAAIDEAIRLLEQPNLSLVLETLWRRLRERKGTRRSEKDLVGTGGGSRPHPQRRTEMWSPLAISPLASPTPSS